MTTSRIRNENTAASRASKLNNRRSTHDTQRYADCMPATFVCYCLRFANDCIRWSCSLRYCRIGIGSTRRYPRRDVKTFPPETQTRLDTSETVHSNPVPRNTKTRPRHVLRPSQIQPIALSSEISVFINFRVTLYRVKYRKVSRLLNLRMLTY
jgi:hypothetical protein